MVDFSNLNDMCEWEQDKALFLIKVAKSLGMNTKSYGDLAVNPNSGYTYLWLEDYSFTLYMPINCELNKDDVYALWSSPEDGEEVEFKLTESTTLEDLELWAKKLYDAQEEKEDSSELEESSTLEVA